MTATTDTVDETLRAILRDVLGLTPDRAAALNDTTPLFGAMPELDSMAVAGLLTELEDRTGIVIDDDEMGGDMLESFGRLAAFVRAKQAA
jgi:acyl carrier protein